MITISTRCYTTEQLRYLAEGLSYSMDIIFDSPECRQHTVCKTGCKSYAICHDLYSARQYILKKIKEREALESVSSM